MTRIYWANNPRLRRIGIRSRQGYRDITPSDGVTICVQDKVDLFRSKLLNRNINSVIKKA